MIKIYNQNKALISKIKSSIYELRKQNINRGMIFFREIMSILAENILEVIKHKDYFNLNMIVVEESNIMDILNNLTQAQSQEDYILLADYMQLQLIPLLISWQEVIQIKEDVLQLQDNYEQNMNYLKEFDKELYELIRNEPGIADEYSVEPTTNGSITVRVSRGSKSFYLLSNNDPEDAGRIFADTYYNPTKANYVLYGMELLININALIKYKNITSAKVYEPDLNLIKLAVKYGDLYQLSTNRLKIYYDPDFMKFAKESQKEDSDKVVIIHKPSIMNIKDADIKERFERLFLVDSSIRNQKDLMISNFISNIENCNHYVDELENEFMNKNVFIIAAGPSLDKNIDLLKNKPKDSIILAVGTVYKKLVNRSIIPDYTIFADANAILIEQIANISNTSFPMILLSTAYRELATRNQGDKYLICQYDFEEAKAYANQKGYHLYRSGGSVTTTALDICIRLKAKKIILVGADMANTNNQTHATDTAGRMFMDSNGLFPVKSMDGGIVYTTRILNMYKEWIERRIEQTDIEVIDATEGGALIQGTKVYSLNKIIQDISIKK